MDSLQTYENARFSKPIKAKYVPYLNSWKGRYKIPHPTGRYKFLPRAPKAQGEEILVPSHGVKYSYLPAQLLR